MNKFICIVNSACDEFSGDRRVRLSHKNTRVKHIERTVHKVYLYVNNII